MASRLLGLLAGLAGSAAATPLRHAATAGVLRRCNVQASTGTRYLLDNSRLQVKSQGLYFRLTKDFQAHDLQTLALWNSEIVGTDEGDGWIKVGDCFLPKLVGEVPILRPVGPLEAGRPRPQEAAQGRAASPPTGEELRSALAEAADATEAAAARLKRDEALIQELKAAKQDLQQQLQASQSSASTGTNLNSGAAELERQLTQMKEQKQKLLDEVARYKMESSVTTRELERVRTDFKAQQERILSLKQRLRADSTAANGTAQLVLNREQFHVRDADAVKSEDVWEDIAYLMAERNSLNAVNKRLREQLVRQEEEANSTSVRMTEKIADGAAHLRQCQARAHWAEEVSKALQARLDVLQGSASRSAVGGAVALLLALQLAS